MAATETSDLEGLYKRVYSDKEIWLMPKQLHCARLFPFMPASKELGDTYNQPVFLTHENAVTYHSNDNQLPTLSDPIPGISKEARVDSYNAVIRSAISYVAAGKAVKGGPAAFRQAIGAVMDNMLLTMERRQEQDLLYGQRGLGEIESVSGTTLTLTAASFAPGALSGMEGALVGVWDDIAASATQRGSAVAITEVNVVDRTVKLASLPAGTVAGDFLFHNTQRTATTHETFAGLFEIMRGSGSIFNINRDSYSLWQPTSIAVGGEFSFDALHEGLARAMGKGLDEDTVLMVNPRTWKNLLSDIAANRRYDADYESSEAEVGHKMMKFHSQVGTTKILASTYVREGDAACFPDGGRCLQRVGWSDISFRHKDNAGPGNGEIFRELTNQPGYEVRALWAQALFCPKLAHLIDFTGIVNS